MAALDLRLLGGLDVRVDGKSLDLPTRHCGFLLAMLALSPQRMLARQTLVAALWSTRGDVQAKASLRQTLYLLRKALGKAGGDGLCVMRRSVALPALRSDVDRLREALDGQPDAVLALYCGELLANCGRSDPGFEDWLRSERGRLRGQVLAALRRFADDARGRGDFACLERIAGGLIRLDPYDEAARRDWMTAVAAQGRRAAALAGFAELATLLDSELNAAPEPATLRLEARLRSDGAG